MYYLYVSPTVCLSAGLFAICTSSCMFFSSTCVCVCVCLFVSVFKDMFLHYYKSSGAKTLTYSGNLFSPEGSGSYLNCSGNDPDLYIVSRYLITDGFGQISQLVIHCSI